LSSEPKGGLLARARRFWQVHPGAPNLLSTAGSFSPPVGELLAPDASGGYYIDFTVKADEPSWPTAWLGPRETQLHVASAQFGLGCFERFVAGDGDEWLETAIAVADYLVADQAPDGGWPHLMPMPHSYWLQPPWLSAMAQGEAASLLVRAHHRTGEERFAAAAVRALAPLRLSVAEGGVRAELGGGFFPEEYPSTPPSFVLNGAIFALWGCRDVAVGLGDEGASALYEEGVDTLAANIHRFDTGYWSLYDLFPHPVRNLASGAYHLLHLNQLRAVHAVSPRPQFAHTIERFARYQESRVSRGRALLAKVGFRLLVPRNDRLALRLPWAHRPVHGEVVVLCYHAVSDDWDSRLAVTEDQLRTQVSELLERGYRPTTFTEAVAGPVEGKRLAVTFDDGYSSMEERALPLLAELGVPATVFVPTAFVGEDRSLQWPGIDHWESGPSRDELRAMNWEQLRRLIDVGWEIGSHTVHHPRLPELDDEALAAELTDSRLTLERELGVPCRSLAYPYGDFDERVVAAARDAGYAAAGTLPARLDVPRRLAWPRIGIYRGDRDLRFKAKVSPTMRRLRGSFVWPLLSRAGATARAGSRNS